MKLIHNIDVKNKRVLVRADFNVTLDEKGKIIDDFRIRLTLPTIEYLIKNGAKVVLMAHLGKPKGEATERLKMDVVGERLSEYLDLPVAKAPDCVGGEIENRTEQMQPGEILLLENLRFHKEEEENDAGFARELAKLGDIYVNDAFGVCHRKHASVAAIASNLPSFGGLLLEKEINILNEVRNNPARPLTVIIGGVKISTKIKIIKKFLDVADSILLGGALANAVLHIKGLAVGSSFSEKEIIGAIDDLDITDKRIHLPVDTIVSTDRSGQAETRIEPVGRIGDNELILDIGPETEELFSNIVKSSKTIIWNGPMGLFEVEKFSHGTEAVAKAVAECDCRSVVGGGETIAFVDKLGLSNKIFHISTGGGAMLEFLSGEELPGLQALET